MALLPAVACVIGAESLGIPQFSRSSRQTPATGPAAALFLLGRPGALLSSSAPFGGMWRSKIFKFGILHRFSVGPKIDDGGRLVRGMFSGRRFPPKIPPTQRPRWWPSGEVLRRVLRPSQDPSQPENAAVAMRRKSVAKPDDQIARSSQPSFTLRCAGNVLTVRTVISVTELFRRRYFTERFSAEFYLISVAGSRNDYLVAASGAHPLGRMAPQPATWLVCTETPNGRQTRS